MAAETIAIEVAYATADRQRVIGLTVSSATTLQSAIEQSGLLTEFPDIDLQSQKLGIFGQLASLDQHANDGDRIEIYRPLANDPMAVRRQKANTQS